MTAPITFYTHPMSRARTVRWLLEETGLPYDSVQLDYGTSMKAPEYRAINPMGKVPAIKHGDVVVTEVAAIVMYLADLVPEKHLEPPVGSPVSIAPLASHAEVPVRRHRAPAPGASAGPIVTCRLPTWRA